MKLKNGRTAVVVSIGLFLAASASQASAQSAVQKTVANPENTNQEAQNRSALIHEETVDVSFDNTGVVSSVSSLAEIDKNAIPNC